MPDLIIAPTPPGTHIPRLLHVTYPTHVLPPALAANAQHLRELNPGWAYRLYDDDDAAMFIGQAYGPAVLERYGRLAPDYGAARADLFRYLLMYRLGGVYLDAKSSATRPFDEVLQPDDRFLLSQWRNRRGAVHNGWGLHPELWGVPGGEFQQWFIAAAPGHPFLRAVIERVLANIERYGVWRDGVGGPAVVRVTGPIAYTQAIRPLLALHPHRRVPNESALSLVYSVLAGQSHRSLVAGHYDQRRTALVTTRPLPLPPRAMAWTHRARLVARRLAVSVPRPFVEMLEVLRLRPRRAAD